MMMSPRKAAMKRFKEELKSRNKTDYKSMLPKEEMSVEVIGEKPEDLKKGLEMAEEILPEIEDLEEEVEESEVEESEVEESDEEESEISEMKDAMTPDLLEGKSEKDLIELMGKIHAKLGMK